MAWAWACRKGDSDNVDVTVVTRTADRRVAGHLWPLVQRRAVEIVHALWPNGYITAGHAILSEYREYERGVTAAVNASVV